MTNQPSARSDTADLLFQQGKLTEKQLELIRRRQQGLNVPQHRAVIELNYASEEDTYRALARVHDLELVDLSSATIPKEVLDLVPLKVIFHYRLLPLSHHGDALTIALSEPLGAIELGNLGLLLGKQLKIVLTTPSGLDAVIKKHFGLGAETIQRLRLEKGITEFDREIVFDLKTAEESLAADATIGDLVDKIVLEAIRVRASDIHIEPYAASIRLRYRIDGVMQTVPVLPGIRELHAPIVSRLKVMAGLNIAEKRLPHDGRIAMKIGNQEFDLRVSIVPTKHGEAVCLRILGRQRLFLDLSQLGMEPAQEEFFAALTRMPQGMVLLTGPTGSGKTTTLYAALAQANDETRKIITIEDPVEYLLEGISQIQVREEIGLTFSHCLRSLLRHDPDVLLIGEIRDPETAEIAVRAAQTGHLVFSTLHTNDSVSAVTRLLEMKIDAFLISSSLVCSIAQRLARRICRNCQIEAGEVPELFHPELRRRGLLSEHPFQTWKGTGCLECNQNGYRGQIAIYEFFTINEEISDLITPESKTGQLRQAARKYGWRSLRELGWLKVRHGLISIPELERVTPAARLDWFQNPDAK